MIKILLQIFLFNGKIGSPQTTLKHQSENRNTPIKKKFYTSGWDVTIWNNFGTNLHEFMAQIPKHKMSVATHVNE